MYQLNEAEVRVIIDALNLAEGSAKRGKNTKASQFAIIYDQIITDITAIKIKLLSPPGLVAAPKK